MMTWQYDLFGSSTSSIFHLGSVKKSTQPPINPAKDRGILHASDPKGPSQAQPHQPPSRDVATCSQAPLVEIRMPCQTRHRQLSVDFGVPGNNFLGRLVYSVGIPQKSGDFISMIPPIKGRIW